MSDPYSRRSRRPDNRQWDEPDRKPRGGDRDYQRDRPRDHRARDYDGGRDDYDRSGRDRRRYRSRSRERRDPDRSRERERERRHGGRDDDRERDRPRDDRRSGRRGGRERESDRKERPRDEPDADLAPAQPNLDGGRKQHDDHSRRRSASPRRSPSPRPPRGPAADYPADGADDAYLDPLPTRTKSDRHKNAAMSFRVGGNSDSPRDGDRRGRSRSRDGDAMDLEDGERSDYDDDGGDPEVVVEDDGMADMAAMMGFGGFGTTKNKKVAGNNAGAVRKDKSTKYRQYMNRTKGFNRPLSPTR